MPGNNAKDSPNEITPFEWPDTGAGGDKARRNGESIRTKPWKSGGAWVYVKFADHGYQRQRVLIRYTEKDQTVLEKGPSLGTELVADGTAELNGTEFGAGK